jgi:altronate dehydratase large subunit
VAGTLVVQLGCEHLQSAPFADRVASLGVLTEEISIQGVGGIPKCIDEHLQFATSLIENHGSDTCVPASIADLAIVIISSDLIEWTIHHANPPVRNAVDPLVSMGARVFVTERNGWCHIKLRQLNAPIHQRWRMN